MSFKIKRWGTYRTVTLADFVPGVKSYQTPGTGGITTRGFILPFRGRILVMAYASDDTPIWCVYDPASHTIDGPHATAEEWSRYNATHGWSTKAIVWGDAYVVGFPLMQGYYFGSARFFGWDSGLNLLEPSFLHGDRNTGYMSAAGPGWDGSRPCLLSYQWKVDGGVYSNWALIKHTLSGTSIEYDGAAYFATTYGSMQFKMRKFGPYYGWYHADGACLYSSVPTDVSDPYITLGSFGGNWTPDNPAARDFAPGPESGAYMWNTVDGVAYWASAEAPMTPIDAPWAGTWDYRHRQDGGYTLDESDLDGITHGVSVAGSGPLQLPISYNGALGWYIGLGNLTSLLNFTVYALDPHQPSPRALVPRLQFSRPAAWVGEYAVRDDLALEHVLPFPDLRDPSGSSAQPPQVRSDGYTVGSKEIYRMGAGGFTYVRDVKVDLSSYPTSGGDWWWPGSDGDHYDGFWELFAGNGPMVVGRMPDPDWGWLNPLGTQVAWGLGLAAENLHAAEPTASHVLRNTYRVANTTFATMLPGSLANLRRQLRSCPGDDRFTYVETGTQAGAPPSWKAVVGRIVGLTWTTLIDFRELGPPGLGETDWTVWSVAPIPRCRPLPEGGFLVGATLYFDPWADWEWDPGERTATFKYKDGTDSGQGWVPALPGYIGPLPTDDHAPVLLTGYDEWTFGRSLYGPDALLVYDNDGEFIDCLNAPTLYPPDGREIVVVPGGVPRVIFRCYRHGTYSDNAEGWGQYHGGVDLDDLQAPLYACYDLEASGVIAPGAGAFRGFVEMYRVGDYNPLDATWRWETCCPSIYDWQYPKNNWTPPGGAYVREGLGGRMITPLKPVAGQGRSGLRGVGRRA